MADDPEGAEVLDDCIGRGEGLTPRIRDRIHLVTLPMEDRDENAIMVNAIQRHSSIVVQKSLEEGFGLTVTEAMWKVRPIVARKVGGIPEQLVDGEYGLLLKDPTGLKQMGSAISTLIKDKPLAKRLGSNARTRMLEHFMADRHLENYANLIGQL